MAGGYTDIVDWSMSEHSYSGRAAVPVMPRMGGSPRRTMRAGHAAKRCAGTSHGAGAEWAEAFFLSVGLRHYRWSLCWQLMPKRDPGLAVGQNRDPARVPAASVLVSVPVGVGDCCRWGR